MRINQYLASAGLASRRNSEILVKDGRVKLNGAVVTSLATDVGENDEVTLDGTPVRPKAEHTYIMLNKPKGCVCTVSDDLGRKTVLDYIKEKNERLFPVGRLDYDSEGLLILTTDGEFANLLTHPSHGIDKTYVAKIEGEVTVEHVAAIKKGIMLDGKRTAPAKCKVLGFDGQESRVSVVIGEGRNRQVRRMFEVLGLNVVFLKRSQVGPLKLGGLGRGMYRPLTAREIEYFLIRDPEERSLAGRAFGAESNLEEDFAESAPRSEYKSSRSDLRGRQSAPRDGKRTYSDSKPAYRGASDRPRSGGSYGRSSEGRSGGNDRSRSAPRGGAQGGFSPRSSDSAPRGEGSNNSEGKRNYSDSKPAYRGASDRPRSGGSYGRSSEGRSGSNDRSHSAPRGGSQGGFTPRSNDSAPRGEGSDANGSKPRSNYSRPDSPRGDHDSRSGSRPASRPSGADGYKARSERSDSAPRTESPTDSEGKRNYSDSKPSYRGASSDRPRSSSGSYGKSSQGGRPNGAPRGSSYGGRSGATRPARPHSDHAPNKPEGTN